MTPSTARPSLLPLAVPEPGNAWTVQHSSGDARAWFQARRVSPSPLTLDGILKGRNLYLGV